MCAALMYSAGDVRMIDVPDLKIEQPTDAVVRVVRTCVCGSDLHPFHSMPASDQGTPMGTSSSASSRTSAPTSPASSAATSSSPPSPTSTTPASSAARG